MVLPQIIITRYFFKDLNCTIPIVIHNLSQLKFDGEGKSTFQEHLFQVVHFFLFNEIYCKDVMARLLTLTFKDRVSRLCHTLPIDSIHSFDQLAKGLHKAFNKYDY